MDGESVNPSATPVSGRKRVPNFPENGVALSFLGPGGHGGAHLQYTVGTADRSLWLSPAAIGQVIRRNGKLCRVLGMYFGGDPDRPAREQQLHQWLILEDVEGEYPFWYAVQTKPRKESSVEASLESQGVQLLFPRLVYRNRSEAGSRVSKRGRPRTSPASMLEKVEPMFPGYLFVLLAKSEADAWEAVRSNPWVIRIVGTGDEPVPVPDEAIDLIMDTSFGSGLVVFDNGRPVWQDLKAGTPVEITSEPLRGLVGILEKPTAGRKRVRVLLQLLGQEVPVEVDVGSVKAVEDDN
ncbi:MAG: hypothetical protein H5T92_04485 [Synergistales bacterium]|nr:hypothetical protein [Synergistales bacterium]